MPDDKPRAYTQEEVQDQFLKVIGQFVDYWATLVPDPHLTAYKLVSDARYRLEGLAFSILNMLDGYSGGMPAFDLFPHPHPSDKDYCIATGQNYYEPFPEDVDLPPSVHGDSQLHRIWSLKRRR